MCPLFRLISVLETEVNGDLGGVDACLGCPLALFDDEILKDLQSKSRVVKDLVCNALYAAVNWIRELEDLLNLILMVSGAFYHLRFQKITNLHLRTGLS